MRTLVQIPILVLLLCSTLAEAKERRRSRSSSARSSSELNVAPSLGLGLGSVLVQGQQLVPQDGGLDYISGWLGVAVHPMSTRLSPFVAVGTEIGAVFPPGPWEGRGTLELVPSVRGGISLLGEPLWHFFPHLELYALAGFRLGNRVRGAGMRLGAGISIPAFAVLQFEMFKQSFPPIIPWMAEFVYDVSEVPEIGFRVGYHF
jgi:hypothetical protein